MANRGQIEIKVSGFETTTGNELARQADVEHVISESRLLKAATTPAVTQVYGQALQLSGGALTVDLTSLTDAVGAALDLTGLKVQAIVIKNKPTSGADNTDTLNVVTGATNGYNWAGDANSEMTLPINGTAALYLPEGTPDVAAGARTIDFSSTDADATFQLLILAG